MRKIIAVFLTALLAASMVACAAETPAPAGAAPEAATAAAGAAAAPEAAAAPAGKIDVTFWHSMGGAGGEGITQMVADFNAQSETVNVTEQFQGTYDEAITKLKSAVVSDSGPEIMQLYDIGTRWMIDSGYAVELQGVMDRNAFDATQIEPNIAAYYSVDGKLNSMPFNSSTPIMYYNKDAFTAAGLDPENPPKNWDELEAAATALTQDGKPGMAMRVYSWFFEQYNSKSAAFFANNQNGRADKATAVEFDTNGVGIEFFTRLDTFNKSGINANFGRDENAAFNAFGTQNNFITFGSTASLTDILGIVNGAFELGTAYLPELIPGAGGGVSVGGASLWMMNKGDDATKDAAWQFIEYAVSPETQVFWHKQTGYFPVTVKAYDLQEMQDQITERPQFATAIDQLHDSNAQSAGALVGVFTEARGIIEGNWELMLAGELDPQGVVNESAAAINSAIEQYNVANS